MPSTHPWFCVPPRRAVQPRGRPWVWEGPCPFPRLASKCIRPHPPCWGLRGAAPKPSPHERLREEPSGQRQRCWGPTARAALASPALRKLHPLGISAGAEAQHGLSVLSTCSLGQKALTDQGTFCVSLLITGSLGRRTKQTVGADKRHGASCQQATAQRGRSSGRGAQQQVAGKGQLRPRPRSAPGPREAFLPHLLPGATLPAGKEELGSGGSPGAGLAGWCCGLSTPVIRVKGALCSEGVDPTGGFYKAWHPSRAAEGPALLLCSGISALPQGWLSASPRAVRVAVTGLVPATDCPLASQQRVLGHYLVQGWGGRAGGRKGRMAFYYNRFRCNSN